ncbi:MAG: hypothetical protein SOX10_00170 [Duodenibacillus sp.]|nr:hypothetical protein [Duodenibacillus sp.]
MLKAKVITENRHPTAGVKPHTDDGDRYKDMNQIELIFARKFHRCPNTKTWLYKNSVTGQKTRRPFLS